VSPQRILVVGGGHVGLYAALRLSRKLGRNDAEVTIVDPQPHMTYQPFLPEASAGSISPRHSVVPLRRELKKCHVLSGEVTNINHATRTATVMPITGPSRDVQYDHIVVVPGSVSRTLPIPGLRENAVGFKTIGEAIYLRNEVLDQLDVAATTADPEVRRRALTFVFVGGGYAGIEALAEMEDMARDALRYYPELSPTDMHWVLIEASKRILPEVGADLGAYTVVQLIKRGMDVRLGTTLDSCVGGVVRLSDGDSFAADTIVWTAGVKASPLLEHTDLPRDDKGRLTCLPTLQIVDENGQIVPGAWSAGDCAAVPDLTATEPGVMCAPNAQHAVRQAKTLADNLVAVIFGRAVHQYRHKYAGSVASLGLHKGVAQVYGVKLRGFPAWVMHRTYHVSRIPSWNRRLRVLVDWTLALVLKREVVSLGELHEPREPFTEVTPEMKPATPTNTPATPAARPATSTAPEPSVTRRP
jgi:NADH:ubiquinone reductase (H+-translocating)